MHVWGKYGQAWHQLPLDIRETAVLKWTHDEPSMSCRSRRPVDARGVCCGVIYWL
jgi:hypothetical protein